MNEEMAQWLPLLPQTFKVVGPNAFGFAPGLVPALQSANLDLVQLHGLWMYPSCATLTWQRNCRKPHIVSPHGMLETWALQNSRWKKRLAAWAFENQNLRTAGCLHALCEAEAGAMRNYGLKTPICIIPNGIDLPESPEKKVENRNPPWQGHIEPGRKVLLFLSRIHPKKGLINLLRAWAQIRRKEWVLAIAGWDQGGHENELKRLATELGLAWTDARNPTSDLRPPGSVVFLGPQFDEAKIACYQNCDAFILPSFSEGLPMVILEAWAHGKPVLMTSECNLPEGFAANAAIRIETNVEGVAAGLEELFRLSSSDLRSFGRNGQTLVADRFTWPKIAADMKSVYEWVLGGGAKPSCVSH